MTESKRRGDTPINTGPSASQMAEALTKNERLGDTPVNAGLAASQIAEIGGPSAVGVLVTVMEANARHVESVERMVREGQERDLERWKSRALKAEAELDAVRARVWALIFGQQLYEDEGP